MAIPQRKGSDRKMARTQCHRISQRLKGLTSWRVFGGGAKGTKVTPKDFKVKVVEPHSQGEVQ